MLDELIKVTIFPGLLFLILYSLFIQWVDRKLYAKMQNRVGPPLIQPFADLIKLFSKQTIVPSSVDVFLFRILPYIGFASVATAFLFIPIYYIEPFFSLPGSVVIVAYLLTIPTTVIALSGWVSCTPYSIIGGIRCLSQLFSYEVPFFLALLTPAIFVGSWNIEEISRELPKLIKSNPLSLLPISIAFFVSIISFQGKMERKPFDIPDAETEIVAGPFTEYSGRLLGIYRLMLDMEMVVGISFIVAVFLGGPNTIWGIPGIIVYFIKTIFIVFISAVIKTSVARIRIDQMIDFGWRILAPLSLIGMLLMIIIRIG